MSQAVKIWKVLELLKVTEQHLGRNNISSPRLNAELLLCSTLNTKRINLYLDFEKPLNESELSDYREKIKRRLTGEPLQYIIGETEFYGLKFQVNKNVLIPRPETELLVDKTLELIKAGKLENPKILEIGTGSGCISIAIASKALCSITAIDSSEAALKTAQENSDMNNTSEMIKFEKRDFLADEAVFSGFDFIISNPPYIAADEMADLQKEVRDFEPANALTDGKDGLTFYRKVFEEANKSGYDILLEIGDGKNEKIENLLKECSINNYEFYNDLLGIPRVLHIGTT